MSTTINMDRMPASWEKLMLERAGAPFGEPRPVAVPQTQDAAPVFAPEPQAADTAEPAEKQADSAAKPRWEGFRRRHAIRRGAGAVALFALAGLGTTVIASSDPASSLAGIAAIATGTPEAAPANGMPPLPDTESLVLPPVTEDMMKVGAMQPSMDPASFSAEAPNGPAARPFSMGNASALDKSRAVQCLATAIYYEAASEPLSGKQGVAQVVLNRVMHPAFPNTVCGVVYQGSERWTGCQFSFTCDGAMARRPMQIYWDESVRVAQQALSGYVFTPVGWATHYHTWRVWPYWGKTLVSTASVGAHIFHRWRGFWGTPQAFRSAYRGGEPVPGPHARVGAPPAVQAQNPVAGSSAAVGMPGQSAQAVGSPVKAQDFGVVPMPGASGQAQSQGASPRAAPTPPPVATVAGARNNLGKRKEPPRSQVSGELEQSGTWIGEPPR